jgi:cell division septum initiation protein DivIVA
MTVEHPEHDQPVPPLPGHVLDMLEQLMIDIENARQVPLSNSVMVSQEEVLDYLARIQKELPEELRAARWMVREREAYIARTNETARGVIAEAKKRSDEMVSESYIVQEAVEEANTLVRNAESEARRIRLESEDFAERQLAEAEHVLGELLRYVREARAELHQSLPPTPEPPLSE